MAARRGKASSGRAATSALPGSEPEEPKGYNPVSCDGGTKGDPRVLQVSKLPTTVIGRLPTEKAGAWRTPSAILRWRAVYDKHASGPQICATKYASTAASCTTVTEARFHVDLR